MNKIIKQRPLLSAEHFSDNPLLNRIYQARAIKSKNELDLSLKGLLNPNQLGNINQAVELLYQSYIQQSKIVIVGDFDADGATSTALALLALRQFGFQFVEYLIPDRFSQGYGLSVDVAKAIIQKGADLVLTVDNGISSFDGIELLKSKGIQVLITDHHLPTEHLPNADAMVNPNLKSCTFPSKSLAGVGVIFYVMIALRTKLRIENAFEGKREPNISEFLDLVALGTVADVVPLDHNNRILVSQGLNRMRSGSCRVGIQALAEVAKRDLSNLQENDLGFAIAPRLNAAGRLENMSLGVELLICDDLINARKLALELDELNQTRKEFEQEMKSEALAICAKLPELNSLDKAQGIVLYQADWHQGVIGILASRIKDQFHRPVIVFAQDDNGETLRGSARSISGVHMRDLLERIDSLHPDLIIKFGGHAMAAGLTIFEKDLPTFKQVFNQVIESFIAPEQLQGIIYTDGELSANEMTLETAILLRQAGPWGQHFAEPTFEGKFRLLQQRIVGGKHLKLLVENQFGILFDAIWFNVDLRKYPDLSIKTATLVYKLDINEFRGNQKIQLYIEYLST